MEDILSYEQVRDGVRNAINAHPEGADYIYSPPGRSGACLYVYDNEPSCIVGHYLINGLGVGKLAVQKHEGISASCVARALHADGVIPGLDWWAAMFLDLIQKEQDCGVTWGEAYKSASSRVEDRRKNER